MALDYRGKIKRGLDASGKPLVALKKATLEGPIRRDGNPTPRTFYGNTPMSATGETADSIVSKRATPETWEVYSASEHGNMVLASNMKTTHSGSPFAGDTPKAIRDPLTITNDQEQIIEDEILKDLDRVIGGGLF